MMMEVAKKIRQRLRRARIDKETANGVVARLKEETEYLEGLNGSLGYIEQFNDYAPATFLVARGFFKAEGEVPPGDRLLLQEGELFVNLLTYPFPARDAFEVEVRVVNGYYWR